MVKENLEETPENPTEEETVEEETSIEEQESSEKLEIVSSENGEKKGEKKEEKPIRQDIYERMKKAEKEAKEAKEELEKSKEKPSEFPTNVFDLAKTVSALREYNPEELDFIQMMSKAKNISPEEAAKTEEAMLYISARRQKVEADKQIPEPSTKQSLSKKSLDKITPEDISNMPLKEKEEYFLKIGMIKKPRPFGGR